jgi:hypothetical protein
MGMWASSAVNRISAKLNQRFGLTRIFLISAFHKIMFLAYFTTDNLLN